MRLSRKNSSLLSFALIGVALCVGIYFIAQKESTTTQSPSQEPSPTPPFIGSGFVLRNFERSETKSDRKIWQIKGSQAAISSNGNSAQLNDAEILFFKEDGRVITLTSPTADLSLISGTVDHAHLTGGVRLKEESSDGYALATESADFERKSNLITSSQSTTVENQMFRITGANFSADMNSKIVVFRGGVKTILKGNLITFPGVKL